MPNASDLVLKAIKKYDKYHQNKGKDEDQEYVLFF